MSSILILFSVQSRQGWTVEGLEERCKALEKILDDTTRKNEVLENKVALSLNLKWLNNTLEYALKRRKYCYES